MARTHTTYTPEDKKSIILSILTKKTTIQKIAKERMSTMAVFVDLT